MADDSHFYSNNSSLGSVADSIYNVDWFTGKPRGQWVEPKRPKKPARPGSMSEKGYPIPFVYKDHAGRVRRIWRPDELRRPDTFQEEIYFLDREQRNYDDAFDPKRIDESVDEFRERKRRGQSESYMYQVYKRKLDAYNAAYAKWLERTTTASEKRKARLQEQQVRRTAREEKRKQRYEQKYATRDRVRAGWNPWNTKYGEFKPLSEDQYKDIGADYNKILNPEYEIITLGTGERVKVLKSELGVPLGFSKIHGYGAVSPAIDENGTTSTAYVEEAFNGNHNIDESDGCGHIAHIAYCDDAKVLKVSFESGGTYAYFRVPSPVAGELLNFARTKQIAYVERNGRERHVLGVRFWDLIRIRGTRGARYRYENIDETAPEEYTTYGVQPKEDTPQSVQPAKDYKLTDDYVYDKYTKYERDIYDKIKEFQDKYGRRPNKDEYMDMLVNMEALYDNKIHDSKFAKQYKQVQEDLADEEDD